MTIVSMHQQKMFQKELMRLFYFCFSTNTGTSRVHAADLTQFLLVVCLFQTGQWEGCLAQINRDRSGLPEPLNLIRIFIQGE